MRYCGCSRYAGCTSPLEGSELRKCLDKCRALCLVELCFVDRATYASVGYHEQLRRTQQKSPEGIDNPSDRFPLVNAVHETMIAR